ncbi:hypothetical protein QN277_023182 [Acacia crassicarpa]|uniref:TIR domain-containing protein n=1 Tax=Acacia crassicarpa TaxID=499986 RepID=A0AAE1JGF7_9FABA|nr:hypothetical protein QN277_023182 [Acacia crassicarpa]
MASASSSSWTYDVFLSFRGEDTRRSLTSTLYNALRQSGIHAFMDDSGIKRGENISRSLLQAIQRSRMAIIIFSQNYASSRWCMDELLQIMECHRTQAQMVIPIFYKVDPSDVRHHRGSYDIATTGSWRNDRVFQWRKALTAAANIAGFTSTIL